MPNPRKDKHQIRAEKLEEQLRMLREVALHVWRYCGHEHLDSGESIPSDWSEWVNLKRECDKTDTLIGIEKWQHL